MFHDERPETRIPGAWGIVERKDLDPGPKQPPYRNGWLQETFEAQRLISELRLKLFFDVLKEARLGPGVTRTNAMMDAMDGREWLARADRRLAKKEF